MEHKFRLIKNGKIVGYERWNSLAGEWSYDAKSNGNFCIRNSFIPHDAKEQFTGLRDKNGKEIYEGDEMNFKTDKSSPSGGHYAGTVGFHPENTKVVEWDKDRWGLGSFRLSTELKMYEVIGTIHDPEPKEKNK